MKAGSGAGSGFNPTQLLDSSVLPAKVAAQASTEPLGAMKKKGGKNGGGVSKGMGIAVTSASSDAGGIRRSVTEGDLAAVVDDKKSKAKVSIDAIVHHICWLQYVVLP